MMFKPFTAIKRYLGRWTYPLISVIVALSLWIAVPLPGSAFSLFDLIFQGVQVVQLSNLSDRQEVALGGQINQQLVNREIRLYRNQDVVDYVQEIGQRLAEESPRPPNNNFKYTFQVVQDNSINAFATMGGYIYVHTGLLKAADNEAQLASVLAHELGHITEKHAIKQMRQMAIAQGLASAAGLNRNVLVGLGVELALRRPNSRQAEFEADRVGLETLTLAGYPQVAMVEFMEKLLQRGGSVPTVLSTHPGTQDRIAALESQFDPQLAYAGEGTDETDYQINIQPLLQ